MKIEEIKDLLISKTVNGYELKEDQDSYGNPSIWLILKDRLEIVHVAEVIKACMGRCIVATAYKNEEDNTHTVIYHFDIEGLIVNTEIKTDNKETIAITPILSSANWAEREMREMYGVEPVGHPDNSRLFLDPSLVKGVLNEYISLSKMSLGVSETDILWADVNKGIKR
jgi:Ni,Fe-hydrogenase III component G